MSLKGRSRNAGRSATMPSWIKGTQIEAQDLDRVVAAVARHIVPGDGIIIRRDGVNSIISTTRRPLMGVGAVPGSVVAWALVTGLEDDYITCVEYDPNIGSTTGAGLNVAKPWHLRRTPFDGVTITYLTGSELLYTYDATFPEYKRTAENALGYVETQQITPSYFSGEVLTIAETDTGVSGTEWLDISSFSKFWGRVRTT